MGEFLLEGFVHVLLEVRGFDVFNDRSLKRKTRGGVKMTTLPSLSKVTGSSNTSVGFHCLTKRLYTGLVLAMSLKGWVRWLFKHMTKDTAEPRFKHWATCSFIIMNPDTLLTVLAHKMCVNPPHQIHLLLLFEWRLLKTVAPSCKSLSF